MNPQIEESWKKILFAEFEKPYFSELKSFLVSEKARYAVYPPGPKIFEAFNRTPFGKVKVVLLGQDPYHGPGQAHGLCFSVPAGVVFPPSLQNILRELQTDLGYPYPQSGDLSKWADQGVFLLNATLTVRANQAGSHQGRGWETFTDSVISALSSERDKLVFLLWGKYARNKTSLIDTSKHYILEAPHPSPLSVYRGFFGCRHFSLTNQLLADAGLSPVDWKLD
ncbi:uracil-DNA glycosylase [Lentimicrobium sp.]|uniref:uracil-DNA glycosylase n=1 Tax=Lentimicrobium sp. TaxID=2034841 RepID=UPI0025EA8ADE|nr:uracil-DNA glycosylase [Lentimicrobium sp.]MCO5256221.1 uracil-DNA glycosylase [Lentimicrobium sp.]HOP12817.1 uracil-DNA glycosylase [Lentimicrobium sp.]HPF64973.1 uracil-DNA glycosylase [Lentimicrobium sp.]HPJ63098.1 uracil-DNA glycosylase [Lentimicrobium sp.]HPR26969.1 uracil-DNA glycosylase [Lentimicrobium sp.]